MNIFDDIVDYIETQVQTVDPSLFFFENDVFGEEDLSDFFADKHFKFWFEDINFAKDGASHQELINCKLQIYSLRAIESDRQFRDIYCKALDIKNAIVDPKDLEQNLWTDIAAQTLIVEPLETDDNTVVCTLELIIRRDIGY